MVRDRVGATAYPIRVHGHVIVGNICRKGGVFYFLLKTHMYVLIWELSFYINIGKIFLGVYICIATLCGMQSRETIDVTDHAQQDIVFAANDRTFPGMYAKICREFLLGPPPLLLVLEPADVSYQHDDDEEGPITMRVSVKEPSFLGLLGVANCIWGRRDESFMHQLTSRYGVHCVWENSTCQCFVAASSNSTVQLQMDQVNFPKVGGICILGERVVYLTRVGV